MKLQVPTQTGRYDAATALPLPIRIKSDGCLALGQNDICSAVKGRFAATGHLFENDCAETLPANSNYVHAANPRCLFSLQPFTVDIAPEG